MKIWSSNHTFSHPWETVVQAASRKYPNPMNSSVKTIDVLDRSFDKKTGTLKTHRILSTKWGLPDFIVKIVGMAENCYVSEHSEVNAKARTMSLSSRNLTFCNYVEIKESLVYTPDPVDPKNSTILTQEANIIVDGLPMSSYCENLIKNTIHSKANGGRQALEWVINHIKEETPNVQKIFTNKTFS